MSDPLKDLHEAITHVEAARRCIAQNRGYDKELARESFASAVAEVLLPAVLNAVELFLEDATPSATIALAKHVAKKLEGL